MAKAQIEIIVHVLGSDAVIAKLEQIKNEIDSLLETVKSISKGSESKAED